MTTDMKNFTKSLKNTSFKGWLNMIKMRLVLNIFYICRLSPHARRSSSEYILFHMCGVFNHSNFTLLPLPVLGNYATNNQENTKNCRQIPTNSRFPFSSLIKTVVVVQLGPFRRLVADEEFPAGLWRFTPVFPVNHPACRLTNRDEPLQTDGLLTEGSDSSINALKSTQTDARTDSFLLCIYLRRVFNLKSASVLLLVVCKCYFGVTEKRLKLSF